MESYETIRRVGRGHHGTAWLVRDFRDGRHYCLKTINLQSYDETERTQAAGEVMLLRSLDHPCIVRYREHFLNDEGSLCLVMTFCEGGDMASAIRSQKESGNHFAEDRVLEWFAQLALALGHTHERRILHRDLKTQNVFLTRGNLLKLGDYGIARVLDGSHSHAQTVVGTPFYMSPEVCQNRPYSYKSDVWALGCVLYELLALRQAWDGSNLLGLVYKIVQQTYEPPPDHYSAELRALLANMLAKDPDQRPSVAQILQQPLVRRAIQSIADRELSAPPAGAPARGAPAALSPRSSGSASPAPVAQALGSLARVRRPNSGGLRTSAAPGQADSQSPRLAERAVSAAAALGGEGGYGGGGGGGDSEEFVGSPALRSRCFADGREVGGLDDASQLTPAQRMRARKIAAADEAASQLAEAARVQRASHDAAMRRGRLQFETSLQPRVDGAAQRRGTVGGVANVSLSGGDVSSSLSRLSLDANGGGGGGGSAATWVPQAQPADRSAPGSPRAQLAGAQHAPAQPSDPPLIHRRLHCVPSAASASALTHTDESGMHNTAGGGGSIHGAGGSLSALQTEDDAERLAQIAAKQLTTPTFSQPRQLSASEAAPPRDSNDPRSSSHAPAQRSTLAHSAGAASSAAEEEPLPPHNDFEPRYTAAERAAALQAKCEEMLGEVFLPVYKLLKAHHQRQDGSDVRPALVSIVGRERLADCFGVDQLIFQELLIPRS